MKILYVHQHFSTPSGGVGTRSYEMAKAMTAAGHKVTIVCGSYANATTGLSQNFYWFTRRGNVDGIDVIEIDISCSNNQGLLIRAKAFLLFAFVSCFLALSLQYDLILATSTPLTTAFPGILAKWFRRKRFIFEVRDLWPELPKQMGVIKNPILLFLMRKLEKLAYQSADHCVGLAPGIVESIAQDVTPAKVSLIPNGCDLDLFKQKQTGGDNGILPKLATKFTAVFTGTHGRANGVRAILDTASLLQDRTDISFLLIGDGALKPLLVEEARKMGLNNIYFETPLPKRSLAELLPTCSVGLQVLTNIPAFYYGTSPNKFFDYIASGLPVVTNYPGWIADLVRQHSCGLSVTPDNPQAFADAITRLADDSETVKKMGVHSRKLAEANFDRSLQAQEMVRLIQQVNC